MVKYMYLVPINGIEIKCETVEEVAALLAHMSSIALTSPIALDVSRNDTVTAIHPSTQKNRPSPLPSKRELVRQGIPKFFTALETIAGRELSADEFCAAIDVKGGRGLGPRIKGLGSYLSGFNVHLDDLISNELRPNHEKMIWMIAPINKIKAAMATLGL